MGPAYHKIKQESTADLTPFHKNTNLGEKSICPQFIFLENRKLPSIGNSEGHHPPVQGEPNNIIAKAKGGGL